MEEVHTDLSFGLTRSKTPTVLKRSASPTDKDGVPAKLAKYFTHKYDNDVKQYENEWIYYKKYGIFKQNGKKHYFEIVKGDIDNNTKLFRVLTVKLCPEDTSVRVYFNNTGPRKIKKWREFILHEADMKDVFFIKKPRLYFDGLIWKQEIWPVQAALTTAAPVSRSSSNEGNPYFI